MSAANGIRANWGGVRQANSDTISGLIELDPRILTEAWLDRFVDSHAGHDHGHGHGHGAPHPEGCGCGDCCSKAQAKNDNATADDFDFRGAIDSYDTWQDRPGLGSVSVSGNGSTLTMSGNAWKSIDLKGGATVIEKGMVLRGTVEVPKDGIAEVVGIGFDIDGDFDNGNDFFVQLGGREHIDFFEQYDGKAVKAGKTVDFEIDLDAYAGQTVSQLVIVNDDDSLFAAGYTSIWSDLSLDGTAVANGSPSGYAPPAAGTQTFVFEDTGTSYGDGQDFDGNAKRIDSNTMRLRDNTWRDFTFEDGPLVIQDGMTLQATVTIAKGALGEIHGIGLDNDRDHDNKGGIVWQVAGTQTSYGDQSYARSLSDGDTKVVTIDLSGLAGQSFSRLVLVNDDDTGGTMETTWSDIRIGNGTPAPQPVTNDPAPTPTSNSAPVTAPVDGGSVSEKASSASVNLLSKAKDADGDALSVVNLSVVDSSGEDVAFTLKNGVATIDPGDFANLLFDGDTETLTFDYDVVDGKGGSVGGSATLDIEGKGNAFVAGAPNGYNLEVVFNGTWDSSLRDAFIDAANAVTSLIIGDLPDAKVNGNTIDDMRVEATLEAIDGRGGTIGSAGPRYVRSDDYLSVMGQMRFDTADAQSMLSRGIWEDVIFHEMMHTVGFGTLWELMGLVKDFDGDLRFTGKDATKAYKDGFPDIAKNDPLAKYGVPVETDGGSGTAGGHWDDRTFGNEIMTGYVNGSNTLSDMTIAALQDMGYDTIYG
ncbi:leishmanolysin-related zinc metalloendopeptidase [Jannaschia sp. LMIT008]|uniref:leishmanolysin-related zinc metalloendopeptidase n=1 Tax=Jannaschia maritima TaxID=3032585 RepID=UPI0028116EBC|nr:leishmanolysin-related zinc metalloendopeptidase [Jannaschia sp. LMIT008]